MTNRLSRFQGASSLPMLLVSGLIMGLVASPCVGAPLSALILAIGATGNVVVGALSLFAFGWGMSALLIVAGVFPGLLSRPGPWMDTVKNVFAVVLAAFGLYFARRLLPAAMFDWQSLAVLVLLGAGLLLAALKLADGSRKRALVKGLGGICLVVAAYVLLGFAYRTGRIEEVLPPALAGKDGRPGLPWRDFTPRRMAAAVEDGRPVLLYFHSDNCAYCRKLKRETFPDREVRQEVQRYALLDANLSRADRDARDMAKSLAVVGVPAIFLYSADGQLQDKAIGFLDAGALVAKMRAVR
jgi:thiol:disulfide interchange protein DsbD